MFGRLLYWYTMYTFSGALAPDGILLGAKFTLHPSLAFSYIRRVTARYSSSGRQPNFAAWYKEWNYVTFAEGATYIGWAAITLVSTHILVLFSSPTVSCRRLDVYHTSTHGVVLMRI